VELIHYRERGSLAFRGVVQLETMRLELPPVVVAAMDADWKATTASLNMSSKAAPVALLVAGKELVTDAKASARKPARRPL
jgi:hypothetical protein